MSGRCGQQAEPLRQRGFRPRGYRGGLKGLRCGGGAYLPYESGPAGHDGDLPDLHEYGHLRKTERHQLHADRLPCPPHHRDGSWNSKIQGAGEQAQNRRRFWREADPCGGDLSGLCHLDHGKAGEDDLHPGRVSDRFHAPSRDGSYGKSGSE